MVITSMNKADNPNNILTGFLQGFDNFFYKVLKRFLKTGSDKGSGEVSDKTLSWIWKGFDKVLTIFWKHVYLKHMLVSKLTHFLLEVVVKKHLECKNYPIR